MDSPTNMQDSDGILEIDTLKQFTIPKRKKSKKELFETLALDSREYLQDVLHVIKLSYKDRESVKHFSYSRPRLIHNDLLLNEYTEKKKRMRLDGYMEKELQDMFGFLFVETEQEGRKISRDGLKTGNSTISCLGNPKMGVYLCKHADIITAEPMKSRQAGMIFLFKFIKGKVKFMVENRSGTPLEPSPNYDCHLLKTSNIDMSAASPQYVYECTQFYLYEYMEDAEISDRPRQIYPFAVVDFRFQGISSRDASRLGPPVLQQQMRSQTKKSATKKPWPAKDVPIPPLLEPLELKKARHKSADVSSGSRNAPPQLSPSLPKVDLRKNGSTSEKESLSSAGAGTTAVVIKDAVVWSGDLIIDGVPLSAVQLMSNALTFKPCGLRKGINIERIVPLANIRNQYFEFLKSLNQKQSEQNTDGVHCFYAYLVPLAADGDRAFAKFVDYLKTSQAGLVVNLRDSSQIVVLPDGDITQDLNLSKDSSDSVILHCVVLLKRSMSDELKDVTEHHLHLPEQIDCVPTTSADDEKAGSTAPPANVPTLGKGEVSTDAEVEQATEALQSRDPRLRHKPLSQVRAPKTVEVARERPLVVSHSRLVTMFDEMSKLQDKSNIELARMIKMSRHGSASNSFSGQPASVAPRVEPLEGFPRKSPLPSPGLAPDRMMPMSQGPPRPLLGPPDGDGARGGVRPMVPPPAPPEGFQNPWMWRWPGAGPQQGMPSRPAAGPQQGLPSRPAAGPQQGMPSRPAAGPQQGMPSRPAAGPQQGMPSRPAAGAQQGMPSRPAAGPQQGMPSRPAAGPQQGMPSRPAAGPQQGMPSRPGSFPGPMSSNGMYGEWGQPFNEAPFPPGPEFKAAPVRPKEMLSPRAWAELQKKGKGGKEAVQHPPETKPAVPPADFASHPTRRSSDPRNPGLAGDFAGADSGRYVADQRYGGFPDEFEPSDPSIRHPPVDPRSNRHYSADYNMYESNRWMTGGPPNEQPGHDGNRRISDPRAVGQPSDQPGQDATRWPTDPRQRRGPVGDYASQDSDWWSTDQRSQIDRVGQNPGWPSADNSRPVGLLGDYPNQDLNQQAPPRATEPRPNCESGEQPGRNSTRSSADPRVARLGLEPGAAPSRWPLDPRTARLSGPSESNRNAEGPFRNNHSSATVTFDGNVPITGRSREAAAAAAEDAADHGPAAEAN